MIQWELNWKVMFCVEMNPLFTLDLFQGVNINNGITYLYSTTDGWLQNWLKNFSVYFCPQGIHWYTCPYSALRWDLLWSGCGIFTHWMLLISSRDLKQSYLVSVLGFSKLDKINHWQIQQMFLSKLFSLISYFFISDAIIGWHICQVPGCLK